MIIIPVFWKMKLTNCMSLHLVLMPPTYSRNSENCRIMISLLRKPGFRSVTRDGTPVF